VKATAAGPASAHDEYVATLDPGKQAAAGTTHTDGYRAKGVVAGPGSSHADYTATLDPGKQLPSS
jgi:hypothetical protein